MPRYIVGKVLPRGRWQDHEIGVFPFGEAAQNWVEETGVCSRYRMPACKTTPSLVQTHLRVFSKKDSADDTKENLHAENKG
jgi:hypothetical protein